MAHLHPFMTYVHIDVVVQEQFCFGEELKLADEFTSLRTLQVNITRKRPACSRASITLSLSFAGNNGSSFSEFM